MKNYTNIHLHSNLSLLDSATPFQLYVDKAVEYGQKAIAFTEHGNAFQWINKKMYCDQKGIKFIFGVELYMTRSLQFNKTRDNYHVILLAKNRDGIREINKLIQLSTQEDHTYYNNRITFEEFLNISDNVIKTSACLKSPLWYIPKYMKKITEEIQDLEDQLRETNLQINLLTIKPNLKSQEQKKLNNLKGMAENLKNDIETNKDIIRYHNDIYPKLVEKYDYLELQPHVNSEDQIQFNKELLSLSKKYNKPLVVGTDTHSIDEYYANCRLVLKKGKNKESENEDAFDLTFKSYDELIAMFKQQGVVPKTIVEEALENTNKIADSVQDFTLDLSFKYPNIPGVVDEEKALKQLLNQRYKDLKDKGRLVKGKEKQYIDNMREELRVFKKIGMIGFMYSMSDLVLWCKSHGIPVGPCRGSVGGSTIAYISGIIDVDPVQRRTIFSRFANEDRKEIGDIDIDISPDQRKDVNNHIIDKFGENHTGFIISFGTIDDKGTIDLVCKALSSDWVDKHFPLENDATMSDKRKNRDKHKKDANNPYSLDNVKNIKQLFSSDYSTFKKQYPDIEYYLNGLRGCFVSQGIHPSGIVVAPDNLDLPSEYGCFYGKNTEKETISILNADMDECHEVSLVKYDILGLNTLQIIRDTCKLANIRFPYSFEINWDDELVWKHFCDHKIGIFQFESTGAFKQLSNFVPHSIDDLTLVTAAIRPSGESYRKQLLAKIPNKNPSKEIDDLLKDNYGYLIFQEDTIKFLQQICGLSGSDADNIRRAIGRKDKERLDKAMPQILEGFCDNSKKPRVEAGKDAKEFLQIIEDSASYQFGLVM